MFYKLLIYQNNDCNIFDSLIPYIQVNGFTVTKANDDDIAEKIEAKNYDVVILDGATANDRYEYVKLVRATNKNAAVIFITKAIVDNDAINCFNAGTDDYMHVPFDVRELICRMQAVLKRAGRSSLSDIHYIGLYEFNSKTRMLKLGENEIKLSEKESKLLAMLSEYRNTIVPRSSVLKAIWLDDNVFNGRSMDVYVTRLRKYLSEDKTLSIMSIRSQGLALVTQ